jgi:hypothetical protein
MVLVGEAQSHHDERPSSFLAALGKPELTKSGACSTARSTTWRWLSRSPSEIVCYDFQRPLWVISGPLAREGGMSALSPRADMAQRRRRCRLSARSGHGLSCRYQAHAGKSPQLRSDILQAERSTPTRPRAWHRPHQTRNLLLDSGRFNRASSGHTDQGSSRMGTRAAQLRAAPRPRAARLPPVAHTACRCECRRHIRGESPTHKSRALA